MFHYQGSRTDKHVREHEVYAIGYPGDKTTHRGTIRPAISTNPIGRLMEGSRIVWRSAAVRLDIMIAHMIARFQQADFTHRSLYVALIAVPLLLLISLLVSLMHHEELPVAATAMSKKNVSIAQPGLTSLPVTPVAPVAPVTAKVGDAIPAAAPTQNIETSVEHKNKKDTHKKKIEPKTKHSPSQANGAYKIDANNESVVTTSGKAGTYIDVACVDGAEVFVDGIRKGRVGSSPLTVTVTPGKHTVIVSHTIKGIFTGEVELSAGKTVHIKPALCN
jgi:hypothetical protein